jgi:iron complex outermembrane receptor protein
VSRLELLLAVALLVLPLAWSARAAAEADAVADSEAVLVEETLRVVGQRRAYLGDFAPLETPQAAQVIDAIAMDRAGVRALDEALDLSASVARQNNFGGLWNSFAIRGFVGDENLPSGYLVNGFNAGRGFSGARDLSGIERVEVLKGPRAALFGRGEPGGTINLVTKRPTGESGGSIRVSGDSFDTYRGDLDVSSGLIDDRLAARFVGFVEEGDSFRDTVEVARHGMSPSVLWRLDEVTTVLYELEYAEQEVPFDRGVLAIDGELGRIPEDRFLGEPGDGPIEAGVLGHQLEFRRDLGDDWDLLVGFGYRQTSLTGFSTEAELSESRQRLPSDGRTLTRQRRFRDYDAEYLVGRIELGGAFELGGVEHRILFGADRDEFENDQFFQRYRAPGLASDPTLEESYVIDVLAPVYGQFPLPETTPLTDRLETIGSTGVYVQDQIMLSERLQVRFGARYDAFEQDLDDRLAALNRTQSDDRFTPQVGAVFALREDVALYANHARGFRANTGADAAGDQFDPNESRSTEVGLKFESAGGLAGTVSAFFVEQSNILTFDPLNPFFLIDAGRAESRGLELDLGGRIAGVDLALSWAWVDAEVSEDVLDPNFGLVVEAGDRLLNIPEHTLSLQVARDLAIADRPVTVGGGVLYVDDRLGEVGRDFTLPDYLLLRAFLAFEPVAGLQLRAEIDNLADETYYTNSFSSLWIQPGMPRRVRIAADWRF